MLVGNIQKNGLLMIREYIDGEFIDFIGFIDMQGVKKIDGNYIFFKNSITMLKLGKIIEETIEEL